METRILELENRLENFYKKYQKPILYIGGTIFVLGLVATFVCLGGFVKVK